MKTIKSVLLIILVTFGMKNQVVAQETEPTVTVVKSVNLSADEVWKQLRVMDNIDELSSLVAKVEWTGNHGVGGERVCTAEDGQGFFKERIVDFSDAQRSYSYAVVEGVPAKNMVNRFKVVDLGYNQSVVVWTSSFEFVENPQMDKEQFQGFLDTAASEMIANSVKLAENS